MLRPAMFLWGSQLCAGQVHEAMVPVRAPFSLAGASAFLAALRSACHVIRAFNADYSESMRSVLLSYNRPAHPSDLHDSTFT